MPKSYNLGLLLGFHKQFSVKYCIFKIYMWWYKHKVLCGISDIFLTKKLRLVKYFLQIRIESVLLKIYKIKKHPIYTEISLICIILHRNSNFPGFCVIVQAQAALRDLRYFVLTNNSRLVKTFVQMRIEAVLLQTWKIRNHQFMLYITPYCVNLHRIFAIFRIYVL